MARRRHGTAKEGKEVSAVLGRSHLLPSGGWGCILDRIKAKTGVNARRQVVMRLAPCGQRKESEYWWPVPANWLPAGKSAVRNHVVSVTLARLTTKQESESQATVAELRQ